jgi:uncharacterized protein YbjT (DUF2867 family)
VPAVILVIGGRSKIGTALVGELLARGEPVRALVRSPDGARAFPDGVESVVGDLADPSSLAPAMSGCRRVFLLCGPVQDEVRLNRNAIDAARDAGVELLVRSSIIGSSPDSPATFVRDHGACDAYLRESGVPCVVLRPNLFLQNVPENTIPGIDGEGRFYANAGDARISMTDTRDIAAVAAVVLTQPGHEGRAYDVTGPEALSYHDVAAALTRRLERPITYVNVPGDAVREALNGFGIGDWLAGALVDLYEEYQRSGSDGYAATVTDTVQRLTGKPPRTLARLLDESTS